MSSLFEQLWPAFVEEVSEQLETLELEILKADLEQVDVRQLFRQFHTIKSSCGMLDFGSMEEVAHLAEDILGEVREGRSELSTDLVSVLVQSVDALKQQMAEAERTQQAPTPQKELVGRLKDVYEGMVGGGSVEVEQPAEKPANEQEAETDLSVQGAQSEASHEFEILVRQNLKQIAARKTKRNTMQIMEAIAYLREASERLGYHSVDSLLEKLEMMYAQGKDSSYSVATCLADLLVSIEAIASDMGVILIEDDVRHVLSKAFRKDFLKELKAYLGKLKEIHGLEDEEKANDSGREILDRTFRLVNYSRVFGVKEFTEYLNVSYQLLKQIIYSKGDLASLKELSNSICIVLEEDDFETNPERYLSYTEQQIENRPVVKSESLPSSLDIVEELRKVMVIDWATFLTDSRLQELSAFYQKGGVVREIFVDFEFDKNASENFVSWLYDNTDVLTNISVFAEENLDLPVNASLAFLVIDREGDTNSPSIDAFDEKGQFIHYFSYDRSQPGKGEKSEQRIDKNNVGKAQVRREQSTLRINSQRLDKFVSQVGELVMARNGLSHVIYDESITSNLVEIKAWTKSNDKQLDASAISKLNQMVDDISAYRERLIQNDLRLQSSISLLQDEALGLRVVPMSSIFNRMPRLVHSLNNQLGKQVVLETQGENEKIDKSLVDVLMEPMLHLVRNAIDHGIEFEEERLAAGKSAKGRLIIQASTVGSVVNIEVIDDGRGIDTNRVIAKAEKLGLEFDENKAEDLIFAPGFSTSETLTETSGRGVGLDAVKASILNIGGNVKVESEIGKGTRFTLSLPVSVAIQGVLLVESDGQRLAIPERSIEEVASFDVANVQQLNGQASLLLREEVLPLFDLNKLIFPSRGSSTEKTGQKGEGSFLVLSNGSERLALVVSEVLGRQEIFVRDVNPELLNIPGFGGASVLGDGKVVIILDSDSLMQLASRNAQSQQDILGSYLS